MVRYLLSFFSPFSRGAFIPHCFVTVWKFKIFLSQIFYVKLLLIISESQSNYQIGNYCTMLQKLSKCEVKAWLCWNLIILPPLRILRVIKFWCIQMVQKCYFWQFRDSELWNLVYLALEHCLNILKSKFRTPNIAKNNIFGPLEYAKIWFHVKSEWR